MRLTTTTTTAPSTTTPTWAPSVEGSYTERFVDSGDTQRVVVEVGRWAAPTDPAGHPPGWFDAMDAQVSPGCAVDAQRDMVIPLHVTATNTNASFDQLVAFGFNLFNPVATPSDYYTDVHAVTMLWEKDCVGILGGTSSGLLNGLISRESNIALAPGKSIDSHGYLVFRDARTPATPAGDPTYAKKLFLVMHEWTGLTDKPSRRTLQPQAPWQLLPNPAVGMPQDWGLPLAPAVSP